MIVRWRVRVGSETQAQSIRLRVVRHFDANQFTMISSGGLEPIPAGGDDHEFPAQLPILAGDQLAVDFGKNVAIDPFHP